MRKDINSRERFFAACNRKQLDRPPIWIMRQAGRYLPEYRALKEKHSFLKMVQTPDLATEVTLQPVRRYSLDAAILFSDILVIPEAMGQPYHFRKGGGIGMEFALDSKDRIDKLSATGIAEKLIYVTNAIRQIKADLNGEKALIGFAGSPWTLATYMVEGGSSKNYVKVKDLFYSNRDNFDLLLTKITDAVIEYFAMQIAAGVDIIQIFDSWGGILTSNTFWDASAKYMARIVESVDKRVPVIVYSKGSHNWQKDLLKTGADVLGLDWTYPIHRFYDDFKGTIAVQGNMDPTLLNTTPEIVSKEAFRILDSMAERNGFIFNLGHGILPEAKLECMEALVDTVVNYPDNK